MDGVIWIEGLLEAQNRIDFHPAEDIIHFISYTYNKTGDIRGDTNRDIYASIALGSMPPEGSTRI
jgi:hypothetical protein